MSYISRKDRLFRAAGDAVPALRRRSEGRMKTYNSCTDTRAWELEEEPRRQHLLEVINGYSQTLNLGKYVPIDVLINTLLASKDEVINKLKIKIVYLQKIIEAYKKLPLTDEQKRLLDGMLANIKEEDEGLTTTAGDSEFETEEERSYVGDIPESELLSARNKGKDSKLGDDQSDRLTEDNIMSNAEKWLNENMEDCSCTSSSNNLDDQDLQTIIIMKDAEIVSLKNKLAAAQMELREKAKGALDAVHKLEDINESMVDKSELVKQLRISADLIKKLEKEKAELIARLAKQGQPVELQDLENEITTIRSSGNLTPEEETDVIKKELRVLKEYCAKLSAIKEENIHLRNEYERLRTELWSEKRRKPPQMDIAKQNEIDRLKSDHERLSDIDKRLMVLRSKDQFDDGEEADDLMYVRGQLINLENENKYLKDIIKNLEEKLKNNEPLGVDIKESRNIATGKHIVISEQDTSSDKYKKLTERVKELEEERKSLLDELEQYRKYNRKIEEELKHMKSTNLCACDEIRKLRVERDMLKNHTIDNQSLIEEIENLRFEVREIEKLRKDRDRIKARLEELANIEKHFIKLVERTKDFDIMREENDMLKCKCEEMEDLQEEVSYLRASIETHEIIDNEKNMLKEQLSGLQRYITSLEGEVKELRSQCEGLMVGREKQQERATFAMNELRKTIEEKDERICELCCELRHISKMKDDLVDVQSQLKQSIEGIEKEENDKNSEMQNLVTTINHLQSENNKSNEIIDKLQRGETDGHMENLFSLTKIAVDAILEEVDQQKKQSCSSNLTEKYKMLQNENMKLKEESELLHANLLKTQNNCDRLESDLQKMKRDVETTENENISLRRYSSDIENMAEETLENVIKRLKEVIIDNKKLKEENKELSEKINTDESMSDNENKKIKEKSEMLQQFNINEEETKEINVTPLMADSENEEENNTVRTFNIDTNEKEMNIEDNKNISTEQYDDSTVEVIIVDAENEIPQNISIEELILENKRSSKENEELKKEIVRVQNMNNELISEIESIKEGSNLIIEEALTIEQPDKSKEDSYSKEQIKIENCFCPSSTSIIEEQKENTNNLDSPKLDNCVCPESIDDNVIENEGISYAQIDTEVENIMNDLKGLDHESLLAKYELMAKENILLKDNVRKLENQLQNLNDIKNIIDNGDDNDIMKKYNELLKEKNNLTDRLRRCEDEVNRRELGSVARTEYTTDGISRPTKDTFKEQKEGVSKKGTDSAVKESGGIVVSSEEEITFNTAAGTESELTAGNNRYSNYDLGGNDTVNVSKKVAAIDGNDERRHLIETTVDGKEIVAMSKKAADIGGKEGGRRLIDALDEDETVIMSNKGPISAVKDTGKIMIESTLTPEGTTVVKKTGADVGREDDARVLFDQTLDEKQVFDDTAKKEPVVLDSDGAAVSKKEVVGDKNVLHGGGAKVLSQKGIIDKNETDEMESVNLKDGTVVKERIAKFEEEGLKGFDGKRKDSPDAVIAEVKEREQSGTEDSVMRDQEKKADMKEILKEQASKDIAQELGQKETALTTDKSKDTDGKDQSYLELKKKNEDLQNENKKLKDQIKICEEELEKPISGTVEESKGPDDDLKNKYEKLLKENEHLKGQIKQLEEEIKNKDLGTTVKGEDITASAEKEGKATVQQAEDTTAKIDKNKGNSDLKKQNEELLNEIKILKEQTKNYEDKIKDMDKTEKGTTEQVEDTAAKTDKNKENSDLKKQNEELLNEIKKLKDQTKNYEDKIKDMDKAVEKGTTEQVEDTAAKTDKNKENSDLKKQNEELLNEIKKLKDQTKNYEDKIKDMDKAVEKGTAEQVEDTTAKTDKNKENSDLKKQNEELLNEIKKLKEQTKNYEDKIKDMDKAVEKGTTEQVDEYKSKYEALLQENKKLKDTSQIAGAAITTEQKGQEHESEYKKRYDDLLKENEKLKEQVKKCEDELNKANKDSKQGPSKDEAKGGGDKTIEDLKRKNDELLAENNKLKEQNKKYEEDINNKSKDVVKADIKDQTANVGKDLNDEYKKKFEDLGKENAKLKERIKQLEEELAKKGINTPQEKQQYGKTTDDTKRNEETGKLKDKIKQLEEELAKKGASTPKDTKQADDKNEELRKENEKFKERIKQLEAELAKKGTSLPQEKPAELKSPDDSKKYEELRNENERLKERIKQLEGELAKKGVNIPQDKSKEGKPTQGPDDSQKQKPEASTDEINKLKEQIKKYEDELKKQPSVAGDKTIQENNRLKEEIKKLQEQGKPAGDKTTQGVSETEHTALKDKYNKCVKENNDLKSEVKQLQEQVKSFGGDVKTTVNVDQTEQVNKSEYDILKRKNDDLIKENNDLKQQLGNAKTSDKGKPIDNVNGQQNIQSQPKTLDSSRPTAQTEKEKKDVLNTIDGLESQLKNLQQVGASKDLLKSDDGSINTTIKNLTKTLEDEQKRNKGLENEIRRLKDENHKLRNDIAELKGEPPILQRDSIRSSATEGLDKSAKRNLESIREEGTESVDKLKKQIDSLNTRHSQEKEKMEKRYKNNVNTLRGQYQRDVKSVHSMHQESLSRLQQGHEESLSELSAEFERDVNILRDMVKDLRSENAKLKGEIEKLKKMLEILDPDNKKLAELGKLSELLLSTTDYSDILNAGVKKDLDTDGKVTGSGESAKLQDLPRLVVMVNSLLPHEKLNAMTLDELTMLHEQVCAAAARLRDVAVQSAMGAETRIGRLEEHLSNKQARMQRKVAELELAVRRERSRLHSMRNEFDNELCVGGCTPRRPKTRSSSID